MDIGTIDNFSKTPVTSESIIEAMIKLQKIKPLPSEIKVMVSGVLPAGTVILSEDLYEILDVSGSGK